MGQSWTNRVHRMMLLCVVNLSLYLNCFAGVDQGEKKVTLNVVEESCVKVFKQIEKQTKMSFFYSTSDIRLPGKVSIRVVDAALDEVMGRILDGTGLEWIYTDNVITIRKKKEVAGEGNGTGIVADSNINMITVRGKVTAADGNPIPGATVLVKRSREGATTDENGNFSLPNTRPNDILTISSIGYQPREVPVKGKSIMIQLNIDVNKLDETVVKGYYNTTKRLNTGNVSTIKSDVISEQPVGDPIAALIGRVPGLIITQQSGVPGSSFTIMLRGQNSLASGNSPLFIIDGVVFSSNTLTGQTWGGGALGFSGMSPFNNLNPSEIESIEILKDADATAIYGSRGANGVVLITTKKGKLGKTNLDINVYTGTSKVAHFMDLLNTPQYLSMRREAYKNDGAMPNPDDRSYDLNGAWDTTRNIDWQKIIIGGTAKTTNAQITLTGGNENTQFLISGGYHRETTVFPGSFSDRRGSARANLNHTSENNKAIVNLSVGYSNDNSNLPSADYTNQIALPPTAPDIFDKTGNLNWAFYNRRPTWQNPFASLLQKANANTNNLLTNFGASYEILHGLKIKATAGYNNISMDQSITYPLTSFSPLLWQISAFRRHLSTTTSLRSWIIEPQIQYTKEIGNGTLDLLFGSTFQENARKTLSIYASDFSSDELLDNIKSASYVEISDNNYAKYRYSAYFGRINYTWKNKYMINITGRRDGSSRFGSDKQYGNFGALGAGWIFTEEPFIKRAVPFISYGKLRTSYGTTGNDQISDYQYLSTYSSLSTSYQGVNGLYPTNLTNPDYGWELVKKYEAAIEFGLIEDRLFASFSYYNNTTGNQLIGFTLPAITGFTKIQANLPATIKNTGIELEINSTNIKNKIFTWTSNFTLTVPRNKLEKYPNFEASPFTTTYILGSPLTYKPAYRYSGINSETGIFSFDTKTPNTDPVTPQDLVSVQKIRQNYFGGIANSFSYKGFKLNIFIQFVKQTGINHLSLFGLPGIFSSLPNEPVEVLNRWQKQGDVSSVQKYSQQFGNEFSAWSNAMTYSDLNVSDASFIRLKNVSLSYALDNRILKLVHLQKANIYILGQNILTLTKYKGLDPETQTLVLPPLRTLTFGLNISL